MDNARQAYFNAIKEQKKRHKKQFLNDNQECKKAAICTQLTENIHPLNLALLQIVPW
jgi:hypothetical protein